MMKKIKNINDLEERLTYLDVEKLRIEKELSKDIKNVRQYIPDSIEKWRYLLLRNSVKPALGIGVSLVKKIIRKKINRMFS